MKNIKLGKKLIGKNSNPYFIAEVGQNHNGSLAEALRYIQVFSAAGANAS